MSSFAREISIELSHKRWSEDLPSSTLSMALQHPQERYPTNLSLCHLLGGTSRARKTLMDATPSSSTLDMARVDLLSELSTENEFHRLTYAVCTVQCEQLNASMTTLTRKTYRVRVSERPKWYLGIPGVRLPTSGASLVP
jgi:hypothetical protein